MYTIDFETYPIVPGSDVSPEPVGVAIKFNDEPADYLAWGHPTKNNCSLEAADLRLEYIVNSTDDIIVMHNAKFDNRILEEWFGIPVPSWRLNDTMIMAYLNDPRDESLKLKDLVLKYCGIPPDEQTDLKNWILRNVPAATEKTWGAYICKAPGDLVGKYACADVDMTYALYNFFIPIIEEAK